MNGLTLLEPRTLAGLAVVGALALLAAAAGVVGATARARFYGAAAARPWARGRGPGLRAAGLALALAALALTVVGAARPAANPRPQKVHSSGRDVVFLIDVSRSMLAQDVRPTRLDRAKLEVRDVLDVAEGDRVGIVAFAGSAAVKCPLTTDYAFARTVLDDVSPDTIGRGGTNIGEALRAALALLFPDGEPAPAADRARTLVLITDGEDHEGAAAPAAKAAGDKGVRIVAIGLGSDLSGAPVPAADQSARPAGSPRIAEYAGRQVVSKMDPATLRAVAAATPGGVFLNVGTGNVDMDEVYRRLVRTHRGAETETAERVKYTELFQIALGAALALLLTEGLLYARRR